MSETKYSRFSYVQASCSGYERWIYIKSLLFGDNLRAELALGTSQRNFAAALVVATQSFEDRGVLVMSLVVSLATMAVLFPAAKLLNRRAHRQHNPGRLRSFE